MLDHTPGTHILKELRLSDKTIIQANSELGMRD